MRKPFLFAASLFAAAFMGFSGAKAEYPTQPVTIVIGFAAGGTSDIYARLLAEHLERSIGGRFLVESRPGAAQLIATHYVAQSAPDGHTLFLTTNGLYNNLHLHDDPGYDKDDFVPIAHLFEGGAFLTTPPNSPFDSMADIVEYARANPGELMYATTGNGGFINLVGEYFSSVFDIEVTPVHYSGNAPAVTAVLQGEVDFSFVSSTAALPHIDSGGLKALAFTRAERAGSQPDVPTVQEAAAELGMDIQYATAAWYGLFAPAGTPDDIVELLNRASVEFIDSPAIRERLEAQGDSGGGDHTPAEFRAFVEEDNERWARVIQERGITLD